MAEQEASEILERLIKEYRLNPNGVEVEFRKLCSSWAWAKRSDAYTHLLHRYPAKMLAYIPIFFLSTERYAKRGEPILDVFAGTSSTLLESIVHPIFPRSAYGIELNPLARLIGKVKTTVVNPQQTGGAVCAIVSEARSTPECKVPDFAGLDYWFPAHVQDALGKLAWVIDEADVDENIRDFLLVCLSATVRKCSYADPNIPVPVRLTQDRHPDNSDRRRLVKERLEEVERIDPLSVFFKVAMRNVERMGRLCQVKAITDGLVEAAIIGDDARRIEFAPMGPRAELDREMAKPIPDGYIPMVITSPPYGSAQKYTRATKLEMLWLGLADKNAIDKLDKESIGTERIYYEEYNELVPTGYQNIDRTLEKVFERNPYRAGLASAYFRAMDEVLKEIRRVLRPGGVLILVVGDNTAARVSIQNHEFLAEMAEKIGFDKELVLRDPLRSRGMITKRHETAGMVSEDWVIVMRKEAG